MRTKCRVRHFPIYRSLGRCHFSSSSSFASLAQGIQSLLLRPFPTSSPNSHRSPLVKVGPSRVLPNGGAGLGVFLKDDDDDAHAGRSTVPGGTILCLYPGVYTPPLPSYASASSLSGAYGEYESVYLADPPTVGEGYDDNEYLLNLSSGSGGAVGGYIDGNRLTVSAVAAATTTRSDYRAPRADQATGGKGPNFLEEPEHRRFFHLDENPSACGHLVNHGWSRPSSHAGGGDRMAANVKVVPFVWVDVLESLHLPEMMLRGPSGNIVIDADATASPDAVLGSENSSRMDDCDDGDDCCSYYPLPNAMRSDGSPWFLDGHAGRVVHFPNSDNFRYQEDEEGCGGNFTHGITTYQRMMAGAALCSLRAMAPGEELLLDYGLRGPPYPRWASDWYGAH